MCYTFVRESFIFPAISPLFPETPFPVLARMPKLFPPSISFRMSVITFGGESKRGFRSKIQLNLDSHVHVEHIGLFKIGIMTSFLVKQRLCRPDHRIHPRM